MPDTEPGDARARSTRAGEPGVPRARAEAVRPTAGTPGLRPIARPAPQRPAAMLHGPGHRIVHANAAFVAEFGAACVGLPASEALLDLPPMAFAVLDVAFREGRAVACAVTIRRRPHRLVVAPRRDIESGEIDGVWLHLVPMAG